MMLAGLLLLPPIYSVEVLIGMTTKDGIDKYLDKNLTLVFSRYQNRGIIWSLDKDKFRYRLRQKERYAIVNGDLKLVLKDGGKAFKKLAEEEKINKIRKMISDYGDNSEMSEDCDLPTISACRKRKRRKKERKRRDSNEDASGESGGESASGGEKAGGGSGEYSSTVRRKNRISGKENRSTTGSYSKSTKSGRAGKEAGESDDESEGYGTGGKDSDESDDDEKGGSGKESGRKENGGKEGSGKEGKEGSKDNGPEEPIVNKSSHFVYSKSSKNGLLNNKKMKQLVLANLESLIQDTEKDGREGEEDGKDDENKKDGNKKDEGDGNKKDGDGGNKKDEESGLDGDEQKPTLGEDRKPNINQFSGLISLDSPFSYVEPAGLASRFPSEDSPDEKAVYFGENGSPPDDKPKSAAKEENAGVLRDAKTKKTFFESLFNLVKNTNLLGEDDKGSGLFGRSKQKTNVGFIFELIPIFKNKVDKGTLIVYKGSYCYTHKLKFEKCEYEEYWDLGPRYFWNIYATSDMAYLNTLKSYVREAENKNRAFAEVDCLRINKCPAPPQQPACVPGRAAKGCSGGMARPAPDAQAQCVRKHMAGDGGAPLANCPAPPQRPAPGSQCTSTGVPNKSCLSDKKITVALSGGLQMMDPDLPGKLLAILEK